MKYQIINNFLSPADCSELIKVAKPRLESSLTVKPGTGEDQVSEHRISDQMFFDLLETPLVAYIEKRISNITNTPIEHGEPMQVVYYKKGGFFNGHFDDFNPNYGYGDNGPLLNGGHRIITFMIYLNDVKDDGDTYFPKIDLSILPEMGKAFWWNNLLDDGKPDEDAYHVGRETSTDKWIMTKWIREDITV